MCPERFLPLIVFEQQLGVAVRKEIFRLRGLLQSNRVRHPGRGIDPQTADHLQRLLNSLLPDVDLTTPSLSKERYHAHRHVEALHINPPERNKGHEVRFSGIDTQTVFRITCDNGVIGYGDTRGHSALSDQQKALRQVSFDFVAADLNVG